MIDRKKVCKRELKRSPIFLSIRTLACLYPDGG